MQLIKHNLLIETQVCSSVGDSIKILLTCSMIAWQNKEWMPYEGYWKCFKLRLLKFLLWIFFSLSIGCQLEIFINMRNIVSDLMGS